MERTQVQVEAEGGLLFKLKRRKRDKVQVEAEREIYVQVEVEEALVAFLKNQLCILWKSPPFFFSFFFSRDCIFKLKWKGGFCSS